MNFEPAEPAQWKGYRGGAGGKIWYSPDGSHYTRILADVGENLVNPVFVGSRVVFLSDHEGTGALYSALPEGTDLRRHTGLGPYYARHATTDGQRVVYQRAGEIWLLESLGAEPVRLDIRLGETGSGRAPYLVSAKSQLGSFALDSAGRMLATEVRGTVHWLPDRDGPARALLAKPGVRGRLPVAIPGTAAVACASDDGGEDGLDVISAGGTAARRIGQGEFGRILELAVTPDGDNGAMTGGVVRCGHCGTANRVPAAAAGTPRCGKCHQPLPWIADADDATFAEVAEAAKIPVIVDLWAPWCGPCRMVSPALEQLARDLAGKIKLVKVNVDTSPQISRRFEVQAIPTLLVLRHGQVAARQTGAVPAAALRTWVDKTLTAG